jgi:hypothetical protein
MDWIQENKFVSGLLAATILFAGGIFYHGYSEGDDFKDNMAQYGELRSRYDTLISAKPYPNQENLKAREEIIEEYEAVIEEVRNAFYEYKADKLPKPTPGEFSDMRIKMQGDLRKAFNQTETSLPDNCGFGFEKYAKIQPAPYATSKLSYQLGAIQWLLEKLAENEPKAIINIRRELLDVELGPPPAPSTQKNAQRGNLAANPEDEKIFEVMPVELAFTASEASMRNFLKEMANSKEYLYAIRSLRIRNEKQNAPSPKDAAFQDKKPNNKEAGFFAPEENDIFGSFALPDADSEEGDNTDAIDIERGDKQIAPVAAPMSNDEHILKQVMGDEKINIHINFDILLIKGDKATEKKNDESPSSGA